MKRKPFSPRFYKEYCSFNCMFLVRTGRGSRNDFHIEHFCVGSGDTTMSLKCVYSHKLKRTKLCIETWGMDYLKWVELESTESK